MIHRYETSDGQNREETGSIQKVEDNDVLVVRGFYSFIGDDGVEYTVTYVADQDGFRATGDHIPTTSTPKPATDGDVQQFGLDCKILLSLCGWRRVIQLQLIFLFLSLSLLELKSFNQKSNHSTVWGYVFSIYFHQILNNNAFIRLISK